jgi:hypothetical protein
MKQWDEDSDLWLFTASEFWQLPDGILLESIDGKKVVKGINKIGHNRPIGLVAWGVRDPYNHELAPLFTKFMLETK